MPRCRPRCKLLAAIATATVLLISWADVYVYSDQGIQALESQARASQFLKHLVEDARREGHLTVAVVSSQGARGGKALAEAFKQRFGLPKMRISIDLSRGSAGDAHKVLAEHEAGIPSSFDVRYFVDEAVLLLKEAGAIKRIENWEVLLAEIAPEAYKVRDKLSPPPFDGYGFTFATRTDALLYNPRLISESKLPRTRAEYGNPRYKGMYSLPPWITTAMFGILRYNKHEWLDIVRSWGRNKGHMLTFAAGIERLLLGELAFLHANAYYYFEHKALDPNAPIGLSFFEDLTSLHRAMNVVLDRSQNPNAAKLFALWSVTDEASLLFQQYASHPNVYLGKGRISSGVLGELEKRRIQQLTWFDSPQTLAAFRWYETKEGKDYAKLLDRAQREGK